MKKKISMLLIPILLTGCTTYQLFYQKFINKMNTTSLNYQCNEQPLTVALNNKKQQVTLNWQDKRLTLTQGISASGARYSDGIYVFWSKGDEASLYYHDAILLHNCKLAVGTY